MSQGTLFNLDDEERIGNDWKKDWVGMPEYNNVHKQDAFITATFKFRNEEDFIEFNKKIKEHLYDGERVFDGMQRKDIKSTWYPLTERPSKFFYADEP